MNATEMNSVEIQLLKEQVEFLKEILEKTDRVGNHFGFWNQYPTIENDFERIAKGINDKSIS